MARRYTLRRPNNDAKIDALLADLNEQQRAVVEAGGGPLLVIAGAGSGKTRTLTYRVARLIAIGVQQPRILLLTFTNKAAREMLRRVSDLAKEQAQRIWGGTFHHIGHRILREHAELVGYPKSFGIMDSGDAKDLMDVCVSDLTGGDVGARFPKAKLLQRIYSMAVNTKQPIHDVISERYPYFKPQLERIEDVLLYYTQRKHEMGLMDYDDLLLKWLQLFTEHPEVADEYSQRFEHVLVDEYQDTNQLQGEIIDLCAKKHSNVMVVGDDCQSIYSFRGANFENILSFPKRYPNTKQFLLETNYRSTPQILALANLSITFNAHRFDKNLRSVQGDGELPALIPCYDDYQQASFVTQRILDHVEEGASLDSIAVLYRAHYQSMQLQLEMTRRNIPYTVRSGLRFFEQAHVKDVIAFLRFVINPRDELSFNRMARLCDGIGSKLSQRLWSRIASAEDPLEQLLTPDAVNRLPGRARRSVETLQALLRDLSDPKLQEAPGDLVQAVLDGMYHDYIKKSFDNADDRLEDLAQLALFATHFLSITGFLSELSLHASTSAVDLTEDGERPDSMVVLSSVHQSKGLEWQTVFVTSLFQGGFPISSALKDPKAEEEERRLFYVAITRAKENLYLTLPLSNLDRRGALKRHRPSSFIREVQSWGCSHEVELIERWEISED